MSLEQFTRAYITAALWSSTDEDGTPLDDAKYADVEISPTTRAEMEADCRSFFEDPSNADGLALWRAAFGSDEQAGHDFWLTRNGHGAGFLDRFSGETRESHAGGKLTKATKAWGSVDLYIGDDGMVHG